MKAHWNYLKVVLKHKWYVFQECLKLNVPLWIAITHDWDKFLPDEWFAYVHFFFDKDGNKIDRRDKTGYYKPYETGDKAFDKAVKLHLHRNKHHWEYWVDPITTAGKKIPDVYRREMLADWRGASRAYGKSTVNEWWEANKYKMSLEYYTKFWLENKINE